MNLTNTLEKFLLPLADKISTNKSLKAISTGFAILMPITIIGAISTLLASLQVPIYQNFITAIQLKPIFSYIPVVTTNMLSIYAVFLISKSLTEKIIDEGHSIMVGILSLFVFLLLIPMGVTEKQDGVVVVIKSALGFKWLGAPGLFSAMIIGLIVPRIYKFVIDKKFTIKLPDSVPPTISKSFVALIPGFVIAFLFSTLKHSLSLTEFGSVNDLIYKILQAPLTGLGASPFTFGLLVTLSSLFWFFGLHGPMILMPFIMMLYTAPGLENLAAMGAGQPLPHLIIGANWVIYATLGGSGATIGLTLLMAFKARSKQYKTLGKLALPAGICGINEPVIFGVPIVLNPATIVPFILVPLLSFVSSYLLTKFGVLPPLNGISTPLGTPFVFSGWLTGGIKVAIFQIVLIIFSTVMYYPFFKVIDDQALKLESEEEL